VQTDRDGGNFLENRLGRSTRIAREVADELHGIPMKYGKTVRHFTPAQHALRKLRAL
jgi:hypothetical protein